MANTLFFGHRSFIRNKTQTAVINTAIKTHAGKQCLPFRMLRQTSSELFAIEHLHLNLK